MNKKEKIMIFVSAAVIVALLTFNIFATESGSTVQLITKDYIDNYLMGYIDSGDSAKDSQINSLESQLSTLAQNYQALQNSYNSLKSDISDISAEGGNYTAVNLTYGQTLYAAGGSNSSCEVIVRRGDAVAVSPFSDQGLSDLTSGIELYNNTVLTNEHNIIIPRGGDGRGIRMISNSVWVMVRGAYSIG